MDTNRIEKNIDAILDKFIDNMTYYSDLGPYKDVRRTTPGFPILNTANKEYYEYNFYERKLESSLRETVINPIILMLCEEFEIDVKPTEVRGHLVNFSNEHFEDCYPFEFCIKGKNKYIGCRYTGFYEEPKHLKRLYKDYRLENIYIIRWIDEIRHRHESDGTRELTISEFLTEFFDEQISDLVLERIKKAVSQVNDIIGFQTIPRLSLRNLSDFKDKKGLEFESLTYDKFEYQIINEDGEIDTCSDMSIPVEDIEIIKEEFENKKYYEAFYGVKGFSKCFVTAEYLYSIFREGNNFDYTAVISGYLKAVEQLVYEIFRANLELRPSPNVLMKRRNGKLKNFEYVKQISVKKPGTDAWHVPFVPKNEKYFDIALAPLIWLLHDHTDLWRISDAGKEKAVDMLLKYSQECRNDHFHKDNIEEYNRVKCIRNNTILIFYILLGGCKLSNSDDRNREILGISDTGFAKLYRSIVNIPRSQNRFILEQNGEKIKVIRLYDQERVQYTEGGSLNKSKIEFAKVEDYHIEDYESFLSELTDDRRINVTANNYPDKIWLVVRTTGEERLVWEK